MRALQIINYLGLAGAENLVKDLALTLPQHGVDTSVYALQGNPESPIESRLRRGGVPVFSSGEMAFRSPGQILKLRQHLKHHSYDVLHAHLFPSIFWVMFLGFSGPILLTEHNISNRRRGTWQFRGIDRWLYGKPLKVVCISNPVEKALHAWMPVTRSKTVIIPNGVQLERFQNSQPYLKQEFLGMEPGVPLILSVSRLQEHKGFRTLIEAMTLMTHRPHLAIAGDGPERAPLESYVHNLGLQDRVHFLGTRDDVPRLMQTADLYVQPSRMEGFGIAALEAMASGKPVVASNVPGLADVVQDPPDAFFPSGDSRELARRVDAILGDVSLAARLGKRNRERAQGFSIEETARRYAAVYSELTP